MKKSFIISAAALSLFALQARGEKLGELLHHFTYQARIGYNLGGTAPIGMPATIRTLHSYTLQPNLLLGNYKADIEKAVKEHMDKQYRTIKYSMPSANLRV